MINLNISSLAEDVLVAFGTRCRQARVTQEPIRLKYVNLGDFGGSDPVQDSYLLEVKGPYEAMKGLIPLLKRHGLRWDSRNKTWSLVATKYLYSNRKRENQWQRARNNQETAYRELKPLVDRHNEEAAKANKSPGHPSTKELIRDIRSKGRLEQRLAEYGLTIERQWPDRYSVEESKTWVFGKTFPIKDVMKKHGFRWGQANKGKGWWIPTVEYSAIADRWAADVFKSLPEPRQESGEPVFSKMDRSDLLQFVKQVVQRDMEMNEFYDGEVSERDLVKHYMKTLPSLKPHEQERAMKRWQRGGLPRP